MTLEKELEAFTKNCKETSGAGFVISKLKTTDEWSINLSHINLNFKDLSLLKVIQQAHMYLLTQRTITSKGYTLYIKHNKPVYKFEKPEEDNNRN